MPNEQQTFVLVIMHEPNAGPMSSFIYCANSIIAAKRAGKMASYGLKCGMTVVKWVEIAQDEIIGLVKAQRPDLSVIVLPRHGIMRLTTSETLQAYWRQLMLACGTTHPNPTLMLDIQA